MAKITGQAILSWAWTSLKMGSLAVTLIAQFDDSRVSQFGQKVFSVVSQTIADVIGPGTRHLGPANIGPLSLTVEASDAAAAESRQEITSFGIQRKGNRIFILELLHAPGPGTPEGLASMVFLLLKENPVAEGNLHLMS